MFRHPLKFFFDPRRFIYRFQSQNFWDRLNQKSPIESDIDHQLESLPIDNTIEWNKKLKSFRVRGDTKKALQLFEIGIRKTSISTRLYHLYQYD